ncbi:MAG: DNA-3-methyladenine glycosylase I, partial [Candidatus Thorarchaeota archaeon]
MEPDRRWVYRDGRQATEDTHFFESLTRVMFQAGLNWKVMDMKWPAFYDAFANFDVVTVAKFGEKEVERLLGNVSIIRNQQKIRATIKNAQVILEVSKEFGSFRIYIDKLLWDEGIDGALKKLKKRFSRVGPATGMM